MLLLSISLAIPCRAQSAVDPLEYRIKAAFVCKFLGYVEWPPLAFAAADSPIVISVLASDAIIDEVSRTAAGLSVDGRALTVRKFQRGESLAGTHLVYIAATDEARLAESIAALKSLPILVVTEATRGLPSGSMINFVVVDDKVRFDIAPHVAEASRLKISARLLGVARSVIGKAS